MSSVSVRPPSAQPQAEFRRDRLTWMAYLVLAWFAYLQAAPGLVIPHLRDELHLGYGIGGLHVAGFAAGSMAAGMTASRLERALGRRRLFWSAVAVMGVGTVALTVARVAVLTIGSVLVMGIGAGLLLVTIQACWSTATDRAARSRWRRPTSPPAVRTSS